MSKNKINIIFLKKYRIICLRKIYITNAISFSLSFSMIRIILPYLSFQLCSNSSYFPNFKFSPSLQFCNFIFPSFNIYLISFFFLFLTDPNRWSSTRVALWFSWWQNRKPLSLFFSLSLSLSLSLCILFYSHCIVWFSSSRYPFERSISCKWRNIRCAGIVEVCY